jgi:uncharacterized protein YecT (DUF1311 family)
MMMRALTLSALSIAAGAAAADPTLECGITAASQVEIVDCLMAVDETVQKGLDQVLSFARAAAEELDAETGRAESVPALEASQAAWVAYRDAHCGYIGTNWAGGSGTGPAIASCRIELARDRTAALFAALP